MNSHCLPKAPFHAIPFHRVTQSARQRKSETRGHVARNLEEKSGEVSTGHANAGFIHFPKLRRPEDAPRFGERQFAKLLRIPDSRFVADRQFVAAFGPPAGQHRPTIGSLHTNTESVSFGAFTVIWLERTFGHFRSLYLSYEAHRRTATRPRKLKHQYIPPNLSARKIPGRNSTGKGPLVTWRNSPAVR